MAGNDDWCTIESDPGVFTSLIESFGVKNAELAELWSLDDEPLATLINPLPGSEGSGASVHGLIFLFKWQSAAASDGAAPGSEEGKDGGASSPLTGDDVPENLFFARQVTHNACATQAILSVLFNAPNSIVSASEHDENDESKADADKGSKEDDEGGRRLVLGPTLSSFKTFTKHFPPDLRGEAIGSSDEIRTAHNSFGRSEEMFLNDPEKEKRAATDDDDVFHFVAYVPHEDGFVYELDGLKSGPIRIGSYRDGDSKAGGDGEEGGLAWLRVARDAIQTRLSKYSPTEIKFNLMAVVQDNRTYLNDRLDSLVSAGLGESDADVLEIRGRLAGEEEKRAQWALENERRRYNYLPFCVELLRCLAGSGKFETIIDKAKETAVKRNKRSS